MQLWGTIYLLFRSMVSHFGLSKSFQSFCLFFFHFDCVRFLFGIIYEFLNSAGWLDPLHSRCFTSKKWSIFPCRVVSKVTWCGQVIF